MSWMFYAVLSALAAAATAVLAKLGVAGVPSNLAVAIRTGVVLVFAWGIALATGEPGALGRLSPRAITFLIASGIATGVSWLAYFKALSMAPASRVAPIDKLSLVFTLVLAAAVLREPMSWRLVAGVVLMVCGALLTIG